jgi:hypothetical protein
MTVDEILSEIKELVALLKIFTAEKARGPMAG